MVLFAKGDNVTVTENDIMNNIGVALDSYSEEGRISALYISGDNITIKDNEGECLILESISF
jgi:hypothetical protein